MFRAHVSLTCVLALALASPAAAALLETRAVVDIVAGTEIMPLATDHDEFAVRLDGAPDTGLQLAVQYRDADGRPQASWQDRRVRLDASGRVVTNFPSPPEATPREVRLVVCYE